MDIADIKNGEKVSLAKILLRTQAMALPAVLLPLVLCLPLGWYLDARFGTKPWLMVGGLVLAFVLTNGLIFWKVKRMRK